MLNRNQITLFFSLVLLMTFGLAASAAAVGPPALVGVWEMHSKVDGVEDVVYLSLETYSSDGTVQSTSMNNRFSTAHGVWEKTGPHSFTSTSFAFAFDADGVIHFTIKNQGKLEVSQDKQSFTAAFQSEFRLLDGTVFNTVTGTAVGTRLVVEPF